MTSLRRGRAGEWPRLPNIEYGWRMPVKRLSWKLAWWLMRRVVLDWMTPEGQAREIYEALGAYKPKPIRTPVRADQIITSGSSNANVRVDLRSETNLDA